MLDSRNVQNTNKYTMRRIWGILSAKASVAHHGALMGPKARGQFTFLQCQSIEI
jgi:hypothetical protein